VVRAAQQVERAGVGEALLMGRPDVIHSQIAELGLQFTPNVVQIDASPHLDRFADEIYRLRQRKGITRERARDLAVDPNVFGILMVKHGNADTMLSGLTYDYPAVIRPALQFIRTKPGVSTVAGVYMVITQTRAYFLADGLVNIDPDDERVAEIAVITADFVRDLDIEPRIAMLSFSNFGSVHHPQAEKMRRAAEIVRQRRPDLCVDGEMQADVALSPQIMEERYPFSPLRDANVLIFPNLDAANSSYRLLLQLGEADVVGPVLVGTAKSVHALHPSADLREILRMCALAVVQAQTPAVSR
jgi:malate dehydrogenase (oxaloacetate-decarboxylating)(NADP+)